jgi:lipase
MLLHHHRWGPPAAEAIVCVHGLTQHGGIYERLAGELVAEGRSVVALDLRGHGASGTEPPWDVQTHVDDVLETVRELGVEQAVWLGHSFGGRVVATLAARAPDVVEGLVLLDPGLEIPADYALRSAEIDRMDWNFASVDGAVNALLSAESSVAAPREVVAAFVREDLRPGADGRLRFGFNPCAAVVAWSEMARPAPPVAQVPTLLVRPIVPLLDARPHDRRYREELGSLLTLVAVPNGHNVLWEAPEETAAAVKAFLAAAR